MAGVPGEGRSVRLDVGCGAAKCPGFLGADRLALPGVDVIVDLDAPLPFRDDAVDLLVMNHSLEHVRDLLVTLKEVYRICRHGAQFCVVAPYFHQALNLANPLHTQSLNEHTPRFWTDSQHTLVEPSEFSHPHAPYWGLSRSDHGDPGIDFRCLSIEFFYFPEYRDLPRDRQRAARKKYLDVCDQIVYQLIVAKKDLSAAEMQAFAAAAPGLYEPPSVAARRSTEHGIEAGARSELSVAPDERAAAIRPGETTADPAETRRLLARAREEAEATREQLNRATVDLTDARTGLARAREEADATREQLKRATADLTEARAGLARTGVETRAWKTRAEDAQARLGKASERLQATESGLVLWQDAAGAVAAELAGMRRRRLLRVLSRFRPGPDLSPQISLSFQALLDDSALFLGDLRGYRLQPGEDLEPPRAAEYSLRLDRPHLAGLMLAPIIDLPDVTGSLGIELTTPGGTTLASARTSLSEIDRRQPVRFVFPPIPAAVPRIVLRVDVRDTTRPVRLFEWRKRRFLGLRRPATRPFCGLIFD